MSRHASRSAEERGERMRPARRRARRAPGSRRTLLTVLAASAALAVAASGAAYAVFTDRASASAGVGSGAVTLDWDATSVQQLVLPVTGLRPGDSATRVAELSNVGTVPVSEIQLAVTNTVVGQSASDGLLVTIDRCSVPWVSAAGVASCSGVVTSVTAERPVTGRIALTGSPAFATGGVDRLRFVFRLSDSAPTTLRNATGTVSFAVLGNQVPGRQR